MQFTFKKFIGLFLVVFSFVFCSCDMGGDEGESFINLSSISFSSSSLELNEGESKTVSLSYLPQNATNVNVSYSLSNDDVVSISGQSNSGCVVTAKKSGSVILIASCGNIKEYCDIKVNSNLQNIDPYIVLPYVTLEMKRGEKKTVLSSLYGGSASDNSLFSFESSSSCVSVESVNNSCVLQAKNYGASRITVTNQKAQYSASFIVYVPDVSDEVCYLTTKSNVIRVLSDSNQSTNFTVNIVGGKESDNAYTSFLVTEGRDNISLNYNNGICSVTGLKSGRSLIEVENSKCKEKLEIRVIVTKDGCDPYINTSSDFVILNYEEEACITANIIGNDIEGSSEKYSYTVSDPTVISVTQSKNYFYVKALKDGKAKITISNEYVNYQKEVFIIVENSNLVSDELYITTDKKIIDMEIGDEDVKVNVSLIGGNESDKNNFLYSVDDGKVINLTTSYGNVNYSSRSITVMLPEVIETSFLVTAKKEGIAKITISNPKTSYTTEVIVRVFKKGIKSGKRKTINYPSYIKGIKGENQDVTLSYDGKEYVSFFDAAWTSSDESLLEVNGNELKANLNFKGEGICYINCESAYFSNNVRIPVFIAESETAFESQKYIYTPLSFYSIGINQSSYIELQVLNDSKEDTETPIFSVINNDSSVVKTRINGNVLIITGLSEGETTLILSSSTFENKISIIVKVSDIKESYDYPYSFNLPKFIGVVKGEEASFSFTLNNAPDEAYNKIIFENSDKDIYSYNVNQKSVTVKGLKEGDAHLTFTHPLCKDKAEVIVCVRETKEELNNIFILYSDKANYVLSEGEKMFLKVYMNDLSKKDLLSWSCSDLDVLSIDSDGDETFIKALKEGFCKVTASYENTSFTFFITVKNDAKDTDVNINLPSVVELLTNESITLNFSSSDGRLISESNTLWDCGETDIISIVPNNSSCYVKAEKKGLATLSVSNSNLGYKKDIVIQVCDTKESFENSYVIALDKSEYYVQKGNDIDIKALFGTYPLPEIYFDEFKWEAADKSIVNIIENQNIATFEGKNEGRTLVTLSNKYCVNEVKFYMNVYDKENISDYSFVINRFNKLLMGDTINIPYSVLKGDNNEDITSVFDFDISLSVEDVISVSHSSGIFRIKGNKKGSVIINITSKDQSFTSRFMVSVCETESELLNLVQITSNQDHYLLNLNESKDVELIINGEINPSFLKINENGGAVSYSYNSNILKVTAAKEGNSTIDISYNSNNCLTLYFGVTTFNTSENSYFTIQSFERLKIGDKKNIEYVCDKDVYVYSFDENKVNVQRASDGKIVIEGLSEGVSEVVLQSGKEKRYIVVSVYENSDDNLLMNIPKRNITLNKGGSREIIPLFNGNGLSSSNTVYEDVYQNGVILFTNENGILKVKALQEGLSLIHVENQTCNNFDILFEVNDYKEQKAEIEQNENYYLYAQNETVYIQNGNEKVLDCLFTNVSSFPGIDNFEWKCSDDSLISINPASSSCVIKALKNEGECDVTVRNVYASNILKFHIIVSKGFIDNGTKLKYIKLSSNSVTLPFGRGETKAVTATLQNIEGSVNDIVITDTSSSVVKWEKSINASVLSLFISPLSLGYGRLKLSHPKASFDTYLDYFVTEEEIGNVIYLTTNDNYVNVKPGEYKNISAKLMNYDEKDGSTFIWDVESGRENLSIIGEGNTVSLYGLKAGKATISLSHYMSVNKLTFTINVTEKKVSTKYLTTTNNIIETKVSGVMDSFDVNLVGGDETLSQFNKFTVSDSSILSIMGSGKTCYFRALKAGNVQVHVENTKDNSVIPLDVTFICEEQSKTSYYLSCVNSVNYLTPFGNQKTCDVYFNNFNGDNSSLVWTLYSQSVSGDASGEVISLVSNGNRGVITPKNEGVAKVRVSYPKENLKLDLLFFVSNYGTVSFSKTSVKVTEGETAFIPLNIPSYTDNMKDFLSFECDNPDIVNVIGTGKTCAIIGKKEGSTIVRCTNSYDKTSSEVFVTVEKENEKSVKLITDKSCYVLNPRSQNQNLRASIIGEGISEEENNNIQWKIEGHSSLSLYPTKGSDVILRLDKSGEKVKTGSAVITLTHPLIPGYSKTIFVSIEEENDYFTLSKYTGTIDYNESFTVEANIVGAQNDDYDDVLWSLDGSKTEADGTVTKIARLLNTEGKECRIYGLSEGLATLTCYYKGDIKQCIINVNGSRYFKLPYNYIELFPGQTYNLQYQLKPSTSVPTIYLSDDSLGANDKICSVVTDTVNQVLKIKALHEGKVNLTGIVSGVGTVNATISVENSPLLSDKSKTAGSIFVPLYDEGTTGYNNTKNSKTVEFLCHPSFYYVKAEVKGGNSYKDYVSISLAQNHDDISVNTDAGRGQLTVYVNGELPNNEVYIELQQYSDKACTQKVNGQKLTYNLNSYYVRDDGVTHDVGFKILFKKSDGMMSLRNKSADYGEYIKLIDSDVNYVGNGYVQSSTLDFGESENHYLIMEPKHRNQGFKNLKISVSGSPKYSWAGEKFRSDSTDIEVTASDFYADKYNYVSLISTGNSCDLGYECDLNTSNQIYKPTVLTDDMKYFYPYFFAKHYYVWVTYEGSVIAERDLTAGGDPIGYYGGSIDHNGNVPSDWPDHLWGGIDGRAHYPFTYQVQKYTSSSTWHWEDVLGYYYLRPNLDISGGTDIDGYYVRIGNWYFCIAGCRAFIDWDNLSRYEQHVFKEYYGEVCPNLYGAIRHESYVGQSINMSSINYWDVFYKPETSHRINTSRVYLSSVRMGTAYDCANAAGPVCTIKGGFKYNEVPIEKGKDSNTVIYDGTGANPRYGDGRRIPADSNEEIGPGSVVRKNYLDCEWLSSLKDQSGAYSLNITSAIPYRTPQSFDIFITFSDVNGKATTVKLPSTLTLYACPKVQNPDSITHQNNRILPRKHK